MFWKKVTLVFFGIVLISNLSSLPQVRLKAEILEAKNYLFISEIGYTKNFAFQDKCNQNFGNEDLENLTNLCSFDKWVEIYNPTSEDINFHGLLKMGTTSTSEVKFHIQSQGFVLISNKYGALISNLERQNIAISQKIYPLTSISKNFVENDNTVDRYIRVSLQDLEGNTISDRQIEDIELLEEKAGKNIPFSSEYESSRHSLEFCSEENHDSLFPSKKFFKLEEKKYYSSPLSTECQNLAYYDLKPEIPEVVEIIENPELEIPIEIPETEINVVNPEIVLEPEIQPEIVLEPEIQIEEVYLEESINSPSPSIVNVPETSNSVLVNTESAPSNLQTTTNEISVQRKSPEVTLNPKNNVLLIQQIKETLNTNSASFRNIRYASFKPYKSININSLHSRTRKIRNPKIEIQTFSIKKTSYISNWTINWGLISLIILYKLFNFCQSIFNDNKNSKACYESRIFYKNKAYY